MEKRVPGIEKLKKREWNPKKQKKILTLSFKDVVYWENFYFSLGLVLSLNILYLLISCYDYTILSLVCMLFSVNIACFVLYRFIISVTGKEGWVISKVTITKEQVDVLVDNAIATLNKMIHGYVKLIRAKNYKKSLIAVLVLFIVSRIFNYFKDLGLIMLILNGVLVVPFLLDTFEVEIGMLLCKLHKYLELLMEKVPQLKMLHEKVCGAMCSSKCKKECGKKCEEKEEKKEE